MSELISHHRGIIRSHFEQTAQKYLQVSHQIHARPELGNQEYFAAETLTDLLRDAGFTVTRDIAGHETGFVAHKGSANSGPRIGYLAEYDALPGLGHACGHNLIGTSSVAAAIALSRRGSDGGGVGIWHTGGGGGVNGSAKGSFADAGIFDGIDAALMIHGSGKTQLTSASLAVDPLDFHFTGRAAHASASPEEGINALDAVIQLFTGINALRQQLPGDTRIHGIITHGGEAPNIIPEYASARFYIRASTWQRAQAVSERVRAVAEGAALATGSTLKVERFQNPVKDLITNRRLDTIVEKNWWRWEKRSPTSHVVALVPRMPVTPVTLSPSAIAISKLALTIWWRTRPRFVMPPFPYRAIRRCWWPHRLCRSRVTAY
nr:M20 family metallopeptidase [Pectobacterium sp. PL152]